MNLVYFVKPLVFLRGEFYYVEPQRSSKFTTKDRKGRNIYTFLPEKH